MLQVETSDRVSLIRTRFLHAVVEMGRQPFGFSLYHQSWLALSFIFELIWEFLLLFFFLRKWQGF